VRAEGPWFWDERNRRITDLSSQTLNLPFGQCHPEIVAAVAEQLGRFTSVDVDFACQESEDAVGELAPLLPRGLSVVNLRLNDGSSAVECAVKQARRATGRSRVLTVDGIYLGQTTQAIQLRGWGERPLDILRGATEDVSFAPLPFCRDPHAPEECAAESGRALADAIGAQSRELACVLIDPIMVSSGVVGGKDMRAFAKAAERACREHSVPLVFDECQTFGWVPGHTLARHWGVDVDMLVLGKGIASGFPLAICATRPEFDNLRFGEGAFTNGGHPASIAALRKTVELLGREQEQRRFEALAAALEHWARAYVAGRDPALATRGVGLIRALDVQASRSAAENAALAREISAACLEAGVYVRPYGSVLVLKPCRALSPAELERALTVLGEVVDGCLRAGSGTSRAERARQHAVPA
jgi:4-aminobutyrate aminotransferase-like enzyme